MAEKKKKKRTAKKKKTAPAWSTPKVSERDFTDPNQSRALEVIETLDMLQHNYPSGGKKLYPRRSSKKIWERTPEQEAAKIHARKPDAVEGTNVRLPTTLRSEKLGLDAGGTVKRNSRDGYARGGLTKVPREDDNAALMQAGGYLGGLTETGRGTMAGELRPRGDMSVREAGETMHELARRRRGV
tara:strand:- start:94 stop:648 length:555 start_codon:yes stop_codon:yes gene_type:complete